MHWWHPEWLWGLVAVLGLLGVVVRGERERERRRSLFVGLAPGEESTRTRERLRRRAVGWTLRLLACGALVLAAAGPQWGEVEEKVERQGVDVVVVVDCSASMNARDYQPSRLEAARLEVGELVERLAGNRLGLVGFAGAAYVFCPLTLDTGAARLFLDQLDAASIPVPGTAIGDAIRTAAGLFTKGGARSRFVVLLSDGEDHRSKPLEAAQEAARQGIVIHTVGLGTAEGQSIPTTDTLTGQDDVVRDASGQQVVSRLDARTLREIAAATGGTFTAAAPGNDMLAAPLAAIQAAQKTALSSALQRRYQHRYAWFAGLALLLVLGEGWLVRRS